MQRKGRNKQHVWKQKTDVPSSAAEGVPSSAIAEAVGDRLSGLSLDGKTGQVQSFIPATDIGSLRQAKQGTVQGQKEIWKPKSYCTVSETANDEVGSPSDAAAAPKSSTSLSQLFGGNLLNKFTVDNSTYSLAEIRATFYPKFENEKSDQEVIIYCVS